jgi:hypothetical protein
MPQVEPSFAVNQDDHLQYVDFDIDFVHPEKQHCNQVNELLYAAQRWSTELPHRQQEIRTGTFFSTLFSLDAEPIDLV